MKIQAKTVSEYLKKLPYERRVALALVRKTILKNLPKGYEETVQYGMIGYVVPLKFYPKGYLGDKKTPLPYAALASQKNHMAVYLMSIYGNTKIEKWFLKEYKASGKKMDMGKSCIRFKKVDDLPIEILGKVIAKMSMQDFIKLYKKSRIKK